MGQRADQTQFLDGFAEPRRNGAVGRVDVLNARISGQMALLMLMDVMMALGRRSFDLTDQRHGPQPPLTDPTAAGFADSGHLAAVFRVGQPGVDVVPWRWIVFGQQTFHGGHPDGWRPRGVRGIRLTGTRRTGT